MNQAAHQLIQNRSTLLIYRDCLKLASRMVQQQSKIHAIRALLKQQFHRNKDVFDQDQIKSLKMNAVKGISNYIIYTVKEDFKLQKKQPININEEQEEDLESLHDGEKKINEVK